MPITTRQVTVTTTATLLLPASSRRDSALLETDSGAADVTVGGADVVAGVGPKIRATTPFPVSGNPSDTSPHHALFGRVASGTQVVYVLEVLT